MKNVLISIIIASIVMIISMMLTQYLNVMNIDFLIGCLVTYAYYGSFKYLEDKNR